MIEGWDIKKLGDITLLQGGSQPPKSTFKYDPSDGYIRLLQIRDFKSDDKAVYIPFDKKNKICKEDDILIGRYGASVGKICTGKSGAYNVALMKATPNEELIRKYYLYYLKSDIFQKKLISVSARGAQNGFNKEGIYDFDVPVPPIHEQKEIVEILDKAFESIEKAKANIEKNIENAKELFQSKLNQIFSQTGEGWEDNELGKISKIQYGYTAKVIPDGNVKYIRITDIQDKKVDWDSVPLVNISDEEKSKFVLEKGDIVFARTGATTGKSYLMINPINSVFASYLIRVKCDTSILSPEFLYLFFQSGIYWNQVSSGISGSAQGGFNASKLGKMKIHYPVGKEKQNEFVKSIDIVDNHIQSVLLVYKEELKNLEELKKSILQKAFSGELTNKSFTA
tara:strand:- start:2105 stop:3292 length:1188 start_codon:yes stop_codon:yes gene_type:complete